MPYFGSRCTILSLGISMPCGECGEWISNEWLSWHLCELDTPPVLLQAVTCDDDGCWFFFCCKCKRSVRLPRGCYINADGSFITDSDNDTSSFITYDLPTDSDNDSDVKSGDVNSFTDLS